MTNWRDIASHRQARGLFSEIAININKGSLDLGRRQYSQSLAIAVMEAILCNVPSITAIEFGISKGGGLLELCKAAKFFRDEFDYDIRVLGFDNGTGLPEPVDYRDHPEMW